MFKISRYTKTVFNEHNFNINYVCFSKTSAVDLSSFRSDFVLYAW